MKNEYNKKGGWIKGVLEVCPYCLLMVKRMGGISSLDGDGDCERDNFDLIKSVYLSSYLLIHTESKCAPPQRPRSPCAPSIQQPYFAQLRVREQQKPNNALVAVRTLSDERTYESEREGKQIFDYVRTAFVIIPQQSNLPSTTKIMSEFILIFGLSYGASVASYMAAGWPPFPPP